jgi:hypothetical protein
MAKCESVARWEDVKPLAAAIFRIWTNGGDLRWAEAAWDHFTRLGLASYSTPLERVLVDIRLMSIGSIYLDWCAVTHDERHDDDAVYWLDATDISPIHLGQLVGADDDLGGEAPSDYAIHTLIRKERPLVLRALLDGFGDVNGLFVALWSSATIESELTDDKDEESDPSSSDWDVLNDVTEEKLAAYQWLDAGASSSVQSGSVQIVTDIGTLRIVATSDRADRVGRTEHHGQPSHNQNRG